MRCKVEGVQNCAITSAVRVRGSVMLRDIMIKVKGFLEVNVEGCLE